MIVSHTVQSFPLYPCLHSHWYPYEFRDGKQTPSWWHGFGKHGSAVGGSVGDTYRYEIT